MNIYNNFNHAQSDGRISSTLILKLLFNIPNLGLLFFNRKPEPWLPEPSQNVCPDAALQLSFFFIDNNHLYVKGTVSRDGVSTMTIGA
jgi:hypothetical protein